MTEGAELRWLTEDERAAWLALASLTSRLPPALDRQLQRDAGLSLFEYQVLAGLSETVDQTLRMSELAAFAGGSLPRLSQVVARLERRGWVRRTPDLNDGRSTLAVLTEDGWAKVVDAAPAHVEWVRRLVLDPLTRSQVAQLTVIGGRIVTAVDGDAGWGPGA